jgi:hypothetical protein
LPIGLVSVVEKEGVEDAQLIGSSTLVDINGLCGKLTAEHVVDAFPSNGEIGFIISEQLHKLSQKVQAFSFLTIAKAKIQEEGPDIGFIIIPDAILGQIKALKSFYNLEKRKNIIENPPNKDLVVWCVCGFPSVLCEGRSP